MKDCFHFVRSVIVRGLRWLVVSLGAIAAGYWTGRHSVPGAFSSGPVPAAPIQGVRLAVIPPGAMTLRHRLALVMQNGGSHGPRLMVELYGLSAVELREALKIAESWPGGTRSLLYERVSGALAFLDPQAALTELLKQRPDLSRSLRVASIMALWAKRDPYEALRQWEQRLAKDKFGGNGIDSIIPELAKKDLPLAFAKLRKLFKEHHENHDQQGPHTAFTNLCETLKRTPANREILIRELLKPENSEPDFVWNGLPRIFQDLDYTDPQALDQTMGWMNRQDIAGEVKGAILSGVLASRISREDPATVAEWYMMQAGKVGLPAHRSYHQVVTNWVRKDVNACGVWLNRQEPGPWLDNAINQFSMAAAGKDLEAAFAWSAKITNEAMRHNSLSLAWSRAKRSHSKQEIRQALENAPLSAADRQKLEAKLSLWN